MAKDYVVHLNTDMEETMIVKNVETVTFAFDKMIMYSAEGDVVAAFERPHYKYFNRMDM